METVFYKDEGYEILGNEHKWALSTEKMDEEVWYGNTVQQAWDNLCMDKYNRLIPAKFISMENLKNKANSETKKIDKPTAISVLQYIQNRTDTLLINPDVFGYSQVGESMITRIEDKAFNLWSKIKNKPTVPLTQKEAEDYHQFGETVDFICRTTAWNSQKTKSEIESWVWEINQVLAGKTQNQIDKEFLEKTAPKAR